MRSVSPFKLRPLRSPKAGHPSPFSARTSRATGEGDSTRMPDSAILATVRWPRNDSEMVTHPETLV